MKIKTLIILLSSVSFLSVFSAPIDQNSGYLEHKQQAQKVLTEKTNALNTCRADCRKTYSYYTQSKCDSQVCSSEKSAFNEARQKVDEIHMSKNVVKQKESTLAGMENQWGACTARCLNKPNNQHSSEHCKNVICEGFKNQYESHKAESDNMDENRKKIEDESARRSASKKNNLKLL